MVDTPVDVKKAPVVRSAPVPDVWQSFRGEMDRLFDRFTGAGFGFPALRRMLDVDPWRFESKFSFAAPAVDVSEDDKAYKITAELPGMSGKDIDLAVTGNMIVPMGEKRQEREEKKKKK
jgi:HSP20 family protein